MALISDLVALHARRLLSNGWSQMLLAVHPVLPLSSGLGHSMVTRGEAALRSTRWRPPCCALEEHLCAKGLVGHGL
jgi:hypothetical protein